jgi:light-regulated signal transduction histidine kinase (bacteriophytochrome)
VVLSVSRDSAEIDALTVELESLSYSVSHDLRAPVRAVIGFTLALQDEYGERLDVEGRRLLAIVASEAQRLNTLIDGLLALSRLGSRPMEMSTVDMLGLVHEIALELTELSAPGPSILEIADLPSVRGDRAMLREIWSNLLSNAAKFSGRQAHPKITIEASFDPDHVVYHVRDNGIGFDMQYAGTLFGAFQKLHHGDAFPGTGIGLAIVKRIVHRHGGTIWASAHLGDGATLSFALPRNSV